MSDLCIKLFFLVGRLCSTGVSMSMTGRTDCGNEMRKDRRHGILRVSGAEGDSKSSDCDRLHWSTLVFLNLQAGTRFSTVHGAKESGNEMMRLGDDGVALQLTKNIQFSPIPAVGLGDEEPVEQEEEPSQLCS